MPDNISCFLLGQLPNEKILSFYSTKPIEVFINTSESEGIPVSIMEAISFGTPIIACDVGGISEIVNNKNGILLDPNPSPLEIANAIWKVSKHDEHQNYRQNSRLIWENRFNAEENFKKFSDHLISLIGS